MARMRKTMWTLALAIVAAPICAGQLATKADGDIASLLADYKREVAALSARGEATSEAIAAARQAFLDRLEPASLTPTDVALLSRNGLISFGVGVGTDAFKRAVVRRLESFADDEGLDGAAALALRAEIALSMTLTPEEQLALITPALEHPRIAEAVRKGLSPRMFLTIRYAMHEEAHERLGKRALALKDAVAPDMALDNITGFDAYLQVVARAMGGDRDTTLDMQRHLLSVATKLRQRDDLADAFGGRAPQFLELTISMLKKSGDFIANLDDLEVDTAFAWTNRPSGAARLSDLKGKVVVLDFWATWCAPCVTSIPNTRALAARYEGFPVEIVGLKSREDEIHLLDGPVEADSLAREIELTRAFIEERNMTWTVAIPADDAAKRALAISFLPYVAILDPTGAVRHYGLRPDDPIESKARKIDALLEEFNLPRPDPIADDQAAHGG